MPASNTHSSTNTADAQFLAPQTHQPAGVEEAGGIVVQTEGGVGDMEVTGANIGEEHMRLLLAVSRVLHVKNQDGADLVLSFDMDGETLVVEIVGNERGVA